MEDVHTREWCLYHLEKRQILKGLNLLQVRAILKVLQPEERPHYWIWKDGYEAWMPLVKCAPALRPMAKAQVDLFHPPVPGSSQGYKEIDESKERMIVLEPEATEENPLRMETMITKIVPPEGEATGGLTLEETAEFPTADQALSYQGQNMYEFKGNPEVAEQIEVDHQGFEEKRSVIRYKRRYKVIINVDGNQHTTHTINVSIHSLQVEGKLPYWIPRESFELILERYGKPIYLVCHPFGETRDQVLMIDSISEPGIFQKWLLEW